MAPKSKRAPRSKRSSAPPSEPTHRARNGVIIGGVVLVFLVLGGLFALPRIKGGGSGRPIDVDVPAGLSDDDLVDRLASAGVVAHPRLFSLYLRLVGGAHAKPGKHLLADDLSAAELVHRLRRQGDAARVKVTIPEGFNRWQTSRRLREQRVCDADAFLAATVDRALLDEAGVSGASAEGFLFPATYSFPADADAADVARMMLKEGRARLEKLVRESPDGVSDLQRTLGWGSREIVTLASIVEEEAAVDDERPIIASVFLNRLRDPSFTPHLLQADPTAKYGCLAMAPPSAPCATWLAAGANKPSAAIEHDPDDPWSTYTHEGLPPTPISSPGEKSLRAVLSPASTKYLYFVAKGGGRHTFTTNLDDHEKATKQSP